MKRLLAILLVIMLTLPLVPAFAEDAEMPPPEIQRMIEVAAEQLEKHGGKVIPQSNEYTKWYYNDKREIGWCGVFVFWCAHEANVPLLKRAQIESLLEDNVNAAEMEYEPITEIPPVFVMYEGHVGNIRGGYELTDRFVTIPKPGYQVIYGRLGGTGIIHTGLVESVREIEEGTWELTTIEGNVGKRIKRYCTRYTLNPKQKHRNYKAVPSKERIVEDAQYKLQSEDWYITGFGKTW